MPPQLKNTLVGIFLIGAIAVFVGFVMFLRPSVGDEKQVIYVRFSNINKVGVGTRVLFAGKAVGEVTEISQIYHARETQPSDALGNLFFYQLTLKIDSNVVVYNTDEISIQTSGLLGEKSIAIIPKAPLKGASPQRVTEKTPFYANSIDPLENTFSRLSDIGQKLEDTIDIIKDWLQKNTDNLSHAVTAFGGAMDQIECVARQVTEEGVVAQIRQGTENFSSSMHRIDDALAQMDRDGVFSNMGAAVANIKQGTASFDKIAQTIADGKGTFGKLISTDDMYLRLTAILSKADTVMNDINHYGILFHLNKSWQRMRTKRMTVLNALNTPDGFKDYFQDEMDQINTSMSRLSMLINKAATQPKTEQLLETPRFKQEFAELLRQVDEMANNLKLYNEQLMEKTAQ